MADSPVLHLHNSLRQAKERCAIFLGAGSSYDYGIPTMAENAKILRDMIKIRKPDHGISESTLNILSELCPNGEEENATWNIEDLLTRLYQILDAVGGEDTPFAIVTTAFGNTKVNSKIISNASDELIQFMAIMCDLTSQKYTNHGAGQVEYLSRFFLSMASFAKPVNRLVRVFTTNIDLCIEAAIVRLSQRVRAERHPDIILVDGFESAILPTFNMGCYSRPPSPAGNRCAVYYWKLHGSIDWTFTQPLVRGETPEEGGFSDQSIIVRRVDTELGNSLNDCGAICAKSPSDNQRIVIFPTPAKYSQTYTFPYMDMFEAFRRTLEEVELLICVGTSFPDQHIRSAVRSFVERDNTLLFVIDPQVTDDELKSYFGSSRSVQPVISMGFEEFINEFESLETMTVDSHSKGGMS